MERLDYEYLIRRAYSCGRSFSRGADADIFSGLTRAVALANERPEDLQLQKDKIVSETRIATFIKVAIDYAIDIHSQIIGEQGVLRLQDISSEIYLNPTVDTIDNLGSEANQILLDAGLYPG